MQNVERITLQNAPVGSKVRIKDIEASNAARGRLCALGITPGTEVEVCSQDMHCCIRVHNASLALGNDLAACVECEAIAHSCVTYNFLNSEQE